MDNLLYRVIGYKTDKYQNKSAIKIQKAYKNYRNYQINKRLDIIHNLIPENKKSINKENLEELLYWKEMRDIIKTKSDWCLV